MSLKECGQFKELQRQDDGFGKLMDINVREHGLVKICFHFKNE